MPLEKRRVLNYTGVVAWYCALRLELMVHYVLACDDVFGVFEWGAGGIVHMHLLRWLGGCGRYDSARAAVPQERRRRDALDLAGPHEQELAEWDLFCPEKFKKDIWDEKRPARRSSEPLRTDDESDGSGSDSAPSGGSVRSGAEEEAPLGDDEQWQREAGGVRARNAQSQPQRQAVPADDVAVLKDLELLLQDPAWHPAAIPLKAKRCLQTYNSRRTRRLRRWFLARLLDRTNQHDRHDGPPIDVPPVHGDDTASESDSESEAKPDELELRPPLLASAAIAEAGVLRLMTWNVNAAVRASGDCTFLLPRLRSSGVACLQEVTRASVEWLTAKLGEGYEVLTPQTHRGRAWPHEGHDVAIVYATQQFQLHSCKDRDLESAQQRCLFFAGFTWRSSGIRFTVCTTHLESGACKPGNLRVTQLQQALLMLQGEPSSFAVLAGDLNLRAWEAERAKVDEAGGGKWIDA